MVSIASSLGIGSGIDTQALVAQLAGNAAAARTVALNSKSTANSARVSAVATLKAGLDSLADNYAATVKAGDGTTLKAMLADFIAAANALRATAAEDGKAGVTGIAAGPLAGDSAVRALTGALGGLILSPLGDGSFSLSQLGVSSDRYGKLSLDGAKFDASLAADTAGVTAALSGAAGLAATLSGMRDRLNGSSGSLGVAASRYDRVTASLDKERQRIDDTTVRLTETLTKSFAGMDRQVAQLKAVQSYIEQQVAAWNSRS